MRRIRQRIRTIASIRWRGCRTNKQTLARAVDSATLVYPLLYIDETLPARQHRHLICYGDERERAQNNFDITAGDRRIMSEC
jgi:hypothetical protein